jgi:hypothetical protein
VTATATTTIQNVSVLSRRRRNDDLFDITLSPNGIDIQRPDRPAQHMGWDRVSEWEIEERKNDVLLTLRGGGASTPLVVPGWSVDDLEVLMRELTAGSIAYVPAEPADEEPAQAVGAGTAQLSPELSPEPPVDAPLHQTYEAAIPVVTEEAEALEAADADAGDAAPSGLAARAARRVRRGRSAWKPVVTVLLLGLLATAVILVLLQSAGIIAWSFLGPTS